MTWWTGPSTRPVKLNKYLNAYGLTHTLDLEGIAVDLLKLKENVSIPEDLTIERVRDVETLKKWLYPFTTSFDFPEDVSNWFFDLYSNLGFEKKLPFQSYIGFFKGKPVATSSRFLGSGVAGIYNVSTLPEARGKGIGSAMTLSPLHEVSAMGYRIGILHSTQRASNMYHRLGFNKYCEIGWHTCFTMYTYNNNILLN